MKTDKQLLQLSKNDLLKEYRKLEHELALEMNKDNVELDTQQMVDELVKRGYVVKDKVSYNLR